MSVLKLTLVAVDGVVGWAAVTSLATEAGSGIEIAGVGVAGVGEATAGAVTVAGAEVFVEDDATGAEEGDGAGIAPLFTEAMLTVGVVGVVGVVSCVGATGIDTPEAGCAALFGPVFSRSLLMVIY